MDANSSSMPAVSLLENNVPPAFLTVDVISMFPVTHSFDVLSTPPQTIIACLAEMGTFSLLQGLLSLLLCRTTQSCPSLWNFIS